MDNNFPKFDVDIKFENEDVSIEIIGKTKDLYSFANALNEVCDG